MPLSKGDVDGEIIRCPYHGLEFGPSGQCTLIPGQDLVPQQARVRSFPTVVQDEIVWIWPGDADKADPSKIVAYPYHRPNSGWAWKAAVWHVKCNWELINDNLLDLTHLALVHKSMIGGDSTVHFNTANPGCTNGRRAAHRAVDAQFRSAAGLRQSGRLQGQG